MKLETIVPVLRTEAASNPVMNDVMSLFASRQRARQEVTLRALYYKMYKEGFSHRREAYAQVLQRLAELGVGEIQKNYRGRIVALKNVRITLQSLGKAVLQGGMVLRTMRRRNRYQSLPTTANANPTAPVIPITRAPKPKATEIAMGATKLTVLYCGKNVGIDLPTGLTAKQLVGLMSALVEEDNKSGT